MRRPPLTGLCKEMLKPFMENMLRSSFWLIGKSLVVESSVLFLTRISSAIQLGI